MNREPLQGMEEKAYEKINISKGINLMLIPGENYKSCVVTIYLKRPLVQEEATLNALLPSVMKSSTEKFKTPAEIAKKLQSLYGSSLGVSVDKMGERHILSFRLITAADRYLPEPVFQQALSVLKEMLVAPNVQEGAFRKEYVDIEKEILAEDILSKINDKGRYAFDRCIELMCEGEPYSISEDGSIEDLENIDGHKLYQHYRKVIAQSPIDIVVAGDFRRDEVISDIQAMFSFDRDEVLFIAEEKKDIFAKGKTITEKMEVTQGKLVMGYRTNIDLMDEDYYAMLVYNAVFGGGAHSKLFLNVREKHSLSYSIYSVMEKFKGLLIINAGIEIADYEKALALIQSEMRDMQEGNISEEELSNGKKYLINGMMSLKDSLYSISDFYYNQSLRGKNITIEEMAEKISRITKEDIIRAAQNIKPDLIYFLSNQEEQR